MKQNLPTTLFTAASAALLLSVPALAQGGSRAPSPASTAPMPDAHVLLAERTPVSVTLMSDIKSGANKVGEDVPLQVGQNVYGIGHSLLIAAGTPVMGHIIQSERRGMLGKAGKINFACDYVLMPNNTHVPLRASQMGQSGQGNLAGAVIGAWYLGPLLLLVNGRDVTVHKGAQFTVYVDKDTAVSVQSVVSGSGTNVVPATGTALPLMPFKGELHLLGGTSMEGTITGYDGEKYTIQTPFGEEEISAASVSKVTVD